VFTLILPNVVGNFNTCTVVVYQLKGDNPNILQILSTWREYINEQTVVQYI